MQNGVAHQHKRMNQCSHNLGRNYSSHMLFGMCVVYMSTFQEYVFLFVNESFRKMNPQ